MYNLILVDDEEEVRKGIINKIHWQEVGFKIIGEAANGIEALEIAEKTVPDVIITDIKMPFMDGISLIYNIKESFKNVKIVILTGFDEFEYAQKAVKLSVDEYILKPISSKEFIEVLSKIKLKLDEEISRKRDFEALMEHYEQSIPVLRERFLSSLIVNKLRKDEIIEKSRIYKVDLNAEGYIVSVLDIDFKDDSQQNKTIGLYNIEDSELVRFAVLNIAEEILNNYKSNLLFRHNNYIVIIFLADNFAKDNFIRNSLSILEELKQSIEKYIKCNYAIGVGTYVEDILNLGVSYKSSTAALDYRIMLGSNRIICINDIEPQFNNKIAFDEEKEHMLASSLKVGTKDELEKTIDCFFYEIISAKASFREYNIYLIEMLTTILKTARDLGIDIDRLLGVNFNPFTQIFEFYDLSSVKHWIKDIAQKVKSCILKERQNSCKNIVEKALGYAAANYSDSQLTVDKLCRNLHVSPNYFSSIFKKETKQTFVNYLTNIRLEKAKELLKSTNLKAFEIAARVGYSEGNYFSYCFKRNTGLSPSEYRNKK